MWFYCADDFNAMLQENTSTDNNARKWLVLLLEPPIYYDLLHIYAIKKM